MLTLIGDTIYYDDQAVAWVTVPTGTLRGQLQDALDELPDARPLAEAFDRLQESDDPAKTLNLTADLVKHVEAWLNELKDTKTGFL